MSILCNTFEKEVVFYRQIDWSLDQSQFKRVLNKDPTCLQIYKSTDKLVSRIKGFKLEHRGVVSCFYIKYSASFKSENGPLDWHTSINAQRTESNNSHYFFTLK